MGLETWEWDLLKSPLQTPGHISLTCGVGFVEVARGTRGFVHRRMRLCGECECEGVRV